MLWIFCLLDTSFQNLFYFWLCWVFVAVHGLSLAVASRGYFLFVAQGFSLRWLWKEKAEGVPALASTCSLTFLALRSLQFPRQRGHSKIIPCRSPREILGAPPNLDPCACHSPPQSLLCNLVLCLGTCYHSCKIQLVRST